MSDTPPIKKVVTRSQRNPQTPSASELSSPSTVKKTTSSDPKSEDLTLASSAKKSEATGFNSDQFIKDLESKLFKDIDLNHELFPKVLIQNYSKALINNTENIQ